MLTVLSAECYFEKSNLKKALPLFETCQEGRRRIFGDEHPDTCSTMESIGDCLSEKGQYVKMGASEGQPRHKPIWQGRPNSDDSRNCSSDR